MRAFFFFFFLLSLISYPLPIPAQGAGIGISIEPFLSDLVFEEGEVEKPFVITLSNDSSNEVRFSAFAVDFGSLDVSAGAAFLGAARDIESSYERASWIALDIDSVSVPANGTAELRGKLVNTTDLAPGGHYGAILFNAGDPDVLRNGPANVALEQRISALVFMKKRGGERYGMELDHSTNERDIFGRLRSMGLSFHNTGNVHIVPRGQIDIFDPLGRQIVKGIVNEDSAIVLPGIVRDIQVKTRSIITAWVPGKYTLRLSYRYDGREDFSVKEEKLLVVPPVFLAALGAFAVLFIVERILRRKRRKAIGSQTV